MQVTRAKVKIKRTKYRVHDDLKYIDNADLITITSHTGGKEITLTMTDLVSTRRPSVTTPVK